MRQILTKFGVLTHHVSIIKLAEMVVAHGPAGQRRGLPRAWRRLLPPGARGWLPNDGNLCLLEIALSRPGTRNTVSSSHRRQLRTSVTVLHPQGFTRVADFSFANLSEAAIL